MNKIVIYAPRWHNRTVLIAEWKIGMQNEISITAKKKDGTLYFPNPIKASGEWLKKFPHIGHGHGTMVEVPLDELLKL